MEKWNTGMMVLRSPISTQIDVFIFAPNIPLFHYSNIPAGYGTWDL